MIRIIVVLLLLTSTAYCEDYISKLIPPVELIEKAYNEQFKFSKFHSVVGSKITSFGTRYTVHYKTITTEPVEGVIHLRRLKTFKLDTDRWIIDFGYGVKKVLQK